jgi:hypothetical protein
MTVAAKIALRLKFLARVVSKECKHLSTTDRRLFAGPFTIAQPRIIRSAPKPFHLLHEGGGAPTFFW